MENSYDYMSLLMLVFIVSYIVRIALVKKETGLKLIIPYTVVIVGSIYLFKDCTGYIGLILFIILLTSLMREMFTPIRTKEVVSEC